VRCTYWVAGSDVLRPESAFFFAKHGLNLPENMDAIYTRIRKRARQIVSNHPSPDFYQRCSFAEALSRQYFETNPMIDELRRFVAKHIENDFGHGLEHAIKVAIDAGALIIIENKRTEHPDDYINRRVILAQCAGLLHDIKRKEKDHAIMGASYARKILKYYPLYPDEIEDIYGAIRNHEAFKSTVQANSTEGALISDCLYDADKFRWGPDNFKDTVWAMVSFLKIPFPKFMLLYPKGMERLTKIRNTFRTDTGKKYGPQFIDLGLAIGEELFDIINAEFAHLL
jgi:hypothetical protein